MSPGRRHGSPRQAIRPAGVMDAGPGSAEYGQTSRPGNRACNRKGIAGRSRELRMFDIARVNRRVVGVQAQALVLELDHQLDARRSARAPKSSTARARSGAFPPALFPEGSRTYASVKNDGAAADNPRQAEFGSRRLDLADPGGSAGNAPARPDRAHARRHRERRSAHPRAPASRLAGQRRIALPLGGMGRRIRPTCANCSRRFPTPTPRAPSVRPTARGSSCAAAGKRSRSPVRPGRARVSSSGRPSGIC